MRARSPTDARRLAQPGRNGADHHHGWRPAARHRSRGGHGGPRPAHRTAEGAGDASWRTSSRPANHRCRHRGGAVAPHARPRITAGDRPGTIPATHGRTSRSHEGLRVRKLSGRRGHWRADRRRHRAAAGAGQRRRDARAGRRVRRRASSRLRRGSQRGSRSGREGARRDARRVRCRSPTEEAASRAGPRRRAPPDPARTTASTHLREPVVTGSRGERNHARDR